jgi:hypothetical protein
MSVMAGDAIGDWFGRGLFIGLPDTTQGAHSREGKEARLEGLVRRLRAGEFDARAELWDVIGRTTDPAEMRTALHLVGATGGDEDVDRLHALLTAEDDTEILYYAAEAALFSGHIDLAAPIRAAWEMSETVDQHDAFGWILSALLEDTQEIQEVATVFRAPPLTGPLADKWKYPLIHELCAILDAVEPPLPKLVEAKVSILKETHPTADIRFWRGQPLNVRAVAEDFRALAYRGQVFPSTRWRARFETLTGVDCREMFDAKGAFVHLAALPILEEFLAGDTSGYREGQLYFCGNPVPD